MIFGWGKKKEEGSADTTLEKQIQLSDVSGVVSQILDLRTKQILSDIKSIRDNTEPLISELIMIGHALEKDDLQVDEIDKHLRIIVMRGKQQVIDMIKKDATPLPKIISYDDAENLNLILHQMLKKIGDALGRQTRVIHIFAKKYAEKLKEILIQMNSNSTEIQQLLTNHSHENAISAEILESLKEIDELKNELIKKEQRIVEVRTDIELLKKQIITIEDSIKKIKSSDDYKKLLFLRQNLDDFVSKKDEIKDYVNYCFTRISRPLGRYEHVSSLDKEQKKLLSKLIEDPFEVLSPKNRDLIIFILENVRKGITSGIISVKDTEKSFNQITEIEESLEGFIKQLTDLREKIQSIQNQIAALKLDQLSALTNNLNNKISEKEDLDSKINSLQYEIDQIPLNKTKLVSEVEIKLRKFSNTVYTVIL